LTLSSPPERRKTLYPFGRTSGSSFLEIFHENRTDATNRISSNYRCLPILVILLKKHVAQLFIKVELT